MLFRELHHQEQPLLICNVWDAASAQIAEKLNFQAIGTSSAAIASTCGVDDGEELSFSELLTVVKKITAVTRLPLTVDIEAGYSRDPLEIANHIRQLEKLGVVGINIEDSHVGESRELLDAPYFSEILTEVKKQLNKTESEIFLNVRTDVFLLGLENALPAAIQRILHYTQAGADGIFVPCIEDSDDIKAICNASSLPINVMCMPDLPGVSRLQSLGVKRISMGNFLFNAMYQQLENMLTQVKSEQSFKTLFEAK